jgi:antitoxin component of RelBE/YafQ-DinJ toxin-antitoxin module
MSDENQKTRAGQTKITSISLSKEFRSFMEDYNISPTEAVRKGVAIILFERGLPQYRSELNNERFKALQEICKKDQMRDLPDQLKQVEDLLKQIRSVLL